jgi:hypothetical protein
MCNRQVIHFTDVSLVHLALLMDPHVFLLNETLEIKNVCSINLDILLTKLQDVQL